MVGQSKGLDFPSIESRRVNAAQLPQKMQFVIVRDESVGDGRLRVARPEKRQLTEVKYELPSADALHVLSDHVLGSRGLSWDRCLLMLDGMIAALGIDRSDPRQGSAVVCHLVAKCPVLLEPLRFRRLVRGRDSMWSPLAPNLAIAMDGSVVGELLWKVKTQHLVHVLRDELPPTRRLPLPYGVLVQMARTKPAPFLREVVQGIAWDTTWESRRISNHLATALTQERGGKGHLWHDVLRWAVQYQWRLSDKLASRVPQQLQFDSSWLDALRKAVNAGVFMRRSRRALVELIA